jgi:RNA polymerase sigma factor (sigma-70 family)
LVQRTDSGQGTESLEALYRREYAAMVRLAHLLTGSNAVAEDVVQDAFVSMARRIGEANVPGAYLRATVINGCRAWHRRRRYLAREERTLEPALPDAAADMLDALQALPERQRTALVLRFYLDLPEDEIAAVLDCRPATVRSLVHRGLARMREVIEE